MCFSILEAVTVGWQLTQMLVPAFAFRQHKQDGVDAMDGTEKLVCLENLSFSSLYSDKQANKQQALGTVLAEQVSPYFISDACGHEFGERAPSDTIFRVAILA